MKKESLLARLEILRMDCEEGEDAPFHREMAPRKVVMLLLDFIEGCVGKVVREEIEEKINDVPN